MYEAINKTKAHYSNYHFEGRRNIQYQIYEDNYKHWMEITIIFVFHGVLVGTVDIFYS